MSILFHKLFGCSPGLDLLRDKEGIRGRGQGRGLVGVVFLFNPPGMLDHVKEVGAGLLNDIAFFVVHQRDESVGSNGLTILKKHKVIEFETEDASSEMLQEDGIGQPAFKKPLFDIGF